MWQFVSVQHLDRPPSYKLDKHVIQLSSCHRDLGVILSSDLSWSRHYDHICSNAYRSLYLIRRSFSINLPVPLKKQLYLTLVRSHLSYCSQIWRPRFLKDVQILERVQRRASKYILHDFTSDYKTRLVNLQLLPLMFWLELQDLLFLVKCMKDTSDHLNLCKYITTVTSNTRSGTSTKLKHNYCRTSITRHFFFNRVILLWNSLSHINLDLSINSIRRNIITHLWDHFLKYFDVHDLCTVPFTMFVHVPNVTISLDPNICFCPFVCLH